MIKAILICALGFSLCEGSSNLHEGNSTLQSNYDVIGRDFMNTQKEKLCLLARLNASIELVYKINSARKIISIPSSANNSGSYCDFEYTSLLRLDFHGMTFSLYFSRDHVKEHNIQPHYCTKCDAGHWRLRVIKLFAHDLSLMMDDVPPTTLAAEAYAANVSSSAGGLISHISLQRGYRCTDKELSANMNVTEAYLIANDVHTMKNWSVKVHFHSIEVQPFLVTNAIVKDPLLCRDVSASIVLIITIPIIYFVFFIVIYRLKDNNKLPSCWRKKIRFQKITSGKKPLLSSSTDTKADTSHYEKTQPKVLITCTEEDETKANLL